MLRSGLPAALLMVLELLLAVHVCLPSPAAAGRISNVEPRTDTDGAIVNAHDGQIVHENGTYYWFAAGYDACHESAGLNGCAGCSGKPIGPDCGCGFEANTSVNLYTSTDLVSWTAHGNVLPMSTRPPATSLFSPRALYNDKTGLWVLWYNFVPHYSYAVATSHSPFGPFVTVDAAAGATFRWGNSTRNPKYAGSNAGIGDFSLFKDDDGTAYMLYSHDPAPLQPIADQAVTCGLEPQGTAVALSCPGHLIASISSATYGAVSGDCEHGLAQGKCGADLQQLLTTACVGKSNCTVECNNGCTVNDQPLSSPTADPCPGTWKHLGINATCGTTPGPPAAPPPPPTNCSIGGDPKGCGKLSVAKLSSDFLRSTWDPTTEAGEGKAISGFEAPAMFKRQGIYYALSSSGCCYCGQGGQVYVHTATSPLGPYTLQPESIDFGSGNLTTQGQQTTVTSVAGSSEFIWQGDRWQSAPDQIKAHDFQFWTRLQFGAKGEISRMAWVDQFEL